MNAPNKQDAPVVGGFSADRSDADLRLRARRQAAPAGPPVVAKTPTLLLFVLVIAAGVALFAYQSRESADRDRESAQLRQELEALRAGLDGVSQEINVTGESLNETGTATTQKLRFLESEIRKLWVVANERNKQALASQQEALKALSDEVKKRDGDLATVVRQAKAAETRVREQEAAIKKLTTQLEAQEKTLESLRASAGKEKSAALDRELALQTRVDQVSAQLGMLGEQVKQALQQTQSFNERLQTNQQDIRAMDTFRQQTNRSLTALQATVNEMQQDLDAMKRVY